MWTQSGPPSLQRMVRPVRGLACVVSDATLNLAMEFAVPRVRENRDS
jgi:hypothetical protein